MNKNEHPVEEFRFSPETRRDNIEKLGRQVFDVLVIGGGITGAGIARDAALRGLHTALIEKNDFAAGTSSKSSKLVHGGFRYLGQFEFKLVHEALSERKTLMELAPHLVQPKPCMLPIYEHSAEPPWMINIGMWLYDLLAGQRNIGRHHMISARRLIQSQPELRSEGLRKGAEYYDCKADDFRLVMATVQSAAVHGAVVANYLKAVEILRDGDRVAGVVAEDGLTGEQFPIRARVIANATGPWSDEVREALLRQSNKRVRTTKGVHLIVRENDLPVKWAFMLFSVIDERPIFAIPWKNFVLIGTTDTDYDGDPDRILTERSDVDYLLESINYYFPSAQLNDEKIISTFAGLRPLIFEAEKQASEVTREHEIFEAPENFFSIIGGKLTTYRVMAKQLVDEMLKRLEKSHGVRAPYPRCRTHKIPLFGGNMRSYGQFEKQWQTTLTRQHSLDPEIAQHFVETYGTRIPVLLDAIARTPDGAGRIHPDLPHLWGELTYAVEHEMTVALDDFLIRRTHIFSLDPDQGLGVYQQVLERLSQRLGWSTDIQQAQVERYKMKIRLVRHFKERDSHEDPVYR